MSHYHVMRGSISGDELRIVYHIPIPDTAAEQTKAYATTGHTLRTALADDPDHPKTSVLPAGRLGTGEDTQITNGSIYEHDESRPTNLDKTLGALRSEADARYTALTTAILTRLHNRYALYGADLDVT